MFSLPLTVTTELEAINYMLGTIGELPIETVDGNALGDVAIARNVLLHKTRMTQQVGWHWNTDEKLPIAPNDQGEIMVPAGTMKIDINDPHHRDLDLVWRGNRMYDRKNHTYAIGKTLKFDVVTGLPFSDLPQPARDYVTIAAARVFQAQVVGADILDRLTADDEQQAMLALLQDETEAADANMLTGSHSVRRVLYR